MNQYAFTPDRDCAVALDLADSLAGFRDEFHLPVNTAGQTQTYLCGHSLGLQPKRAAKFVEDELQAWRGQAVEAHFHSKRPWLAYHELLTPGLAALVGAQPDEVVAMNSLTVNLHLLLVSFYRPTSTRFKILIERSAFPSDRYAVASQLRFHGYEPQHALVEIAPRDGEAILRTEDIAAVLEREGANIATVLLPGVQYLSGQLLDMASITQLAHRHGCIAGFDLAHAVGNVPLQLHDWNVDFAVWCSYKYLNSGPGSIGAGFVHARHGQRRDLPRLAGWWGHDKSTRFDMPPEFVPLPGAEGWQLSNPPIFACAPLLASLEVFQTATMERLRSKSLALTAYLEYLLRTTTNNVIDILTPSDPAARGCQLSWRLNVERARAYAVFQALMQRDFICDWREPNIIRIAPVPLYNRFLDVWNFVRALHELLP